MILLRKTNPIFLHWTLPLLENKCDSHHRSSTVQSEVHQESHLLHLPCWVSNVAPPLIMNIWSLRATNDLWIISKPSGQMKKHNRSEQSAHQSLNYLRSTFQKQTEQRATKKTWWLKCPKKQSLLVYDTWSSGFMITQKHHPILTSRKGKEVSLQPVKIAPQS